MAHTYTEVLIHAIFSTKQREPYLSDEIKAELFPYLAGSLQRMKATPVIVNGPRDHVHILFSLPAVLSLAAAMEKLKANSPSGFTSDGPGSALSPGRPGTPLSA